MQVAPQVPIYKPVQPIGQPIQQMHVQGIPMQVQQHV